ncbi:MAG: aldehyde dehydrogenase family protein [Armatimonadota bacterium]|nr:aldehyde dehydrogenase family protein [Armatimonadota bacterium]
MQTLNMLIGGQWVEPASGEYVEDINPANREVVAQVPVADEDDVDRAVASADEAFRDEWGGMPAAEREALLMRMADLIEERAAELAEMDSVDMGKPYAAARDGDVPGAAGLMRFYAGLADTIEGKTLSAPAGHFGYTVREPFGVVGAIVPWNFPLSLACTKCAPALAAGNAVVLKPSSISPRSALALGEIALDAGLPPGTLNVITGPGPRTGVALAEHPGVGRITLTGSTEAGRSVLRATAGNFKKATLELGGKTANIVLPDADMEMALAGACRTIFLNSGQICTAGSRLLLHRDIKDEFLGRLVELAEGLTVGDPFDEQTKMGPLSSPEQYEKVVGYIEAGKREGARLVTGGEPPDDRDLQDGCYMLPTVFDEVDSQMAIAQEEIFGPVLAVMTYESEEEAVALANDTEYGLAAALWSRDLSTAHRMAAGLEAGIIWINCTNVVGPWMPYGGYRISGLGFESGVAGLLEFTRSKTVLADLTDQPAPWALE